MTLSPRTSTLMSWIRNVRGSILWLTGYVRDGSMSQLATLLASEGSTAVLSSGGTPHEMDRRHEHGVACRPDRWRAHEGSLGVWARPEQESAAVDFLKLASTQRGAGVPLMRLAWDQPADILTIERQ